MSATPLSNTGTRSRARQFAGAPSSGTSGTLAGLAEPGAMLWDSKHGVAFINENTKASPYWVPMSMDSFGMFGVWDDFRDNVGTAISGTTMSVIKAGSGIRIHGDGHADTDSGLVVQTAGEGGIVARMTTTNEAAHMLAVGMPAGVMQPDQHDLLVVEAEISHVSAITDRTVFLGFTGLGADARVAAVTGATTVATLVDDDLAGLFFSSNLTDADRLFGVHNKSNEAATQDLTADGDTSTDVPAAATYQRLRVEIDSAGLMTAFADKVQIYSVAAALDVDEEVTPVLYLESLAAAIKSADLRRFSAYAFRA